MHWKLHKVALRNISISFGGDVEHSSIVKRGAHPAFGREVSSPAHLPTQLSQAPPVFLRQATTVSHAKRNWFQNSQGSQRCKDFIIEEDIPLLVDSNRKVMTGILPAIGTEAWKGQEPFLSGPVLLEGVLVLSEEGSTVESEISVPWSALVDNRFQISTLVMGMLSESIHFIATDSEALYPAFVASLWNIGSQPDELPQKANGSTVYTRMWQHGVVLNALQRMTGGKWKLAGVLSGLQELSTSATPLELWIVIGQLFETFSGKDLNIVEILSEAIDLVEDIELKQLYELNTQSQIEIKHLERFLKVGLFHFYQKDINAALTTFRFTRLIPYLCDLGMVADPTKIIVLSLESAVDFFELSVDWMKFIASVPDLAQMAKKAKDCASGHGEDMAFLSKGLYAQGGDLLCDLMDSLVKGLDRVEFLQQFASKALQSEDGCHQSLHTFREEIESCMNKLGILNNDLESLRFSHDRFERAIVDTFNPVFKTVEKCYQRVREGTYEGRVELFAGTGNKGTTSGPAATSSFEEISATAELPNGIIVVLSGHHIRLVSEGVVSTATATEPATGHKDGLLVNALLDSPSSLWVCKDGSVLIADKGNHCIRTISSDLQYVNTLFGQPKQPGLVDGDQDFSLFRNPSDVIELSDGSLLIADTGNNCLRKATLCLGRWKVATIQVSLKSNKKKEVFTKPIAIREDFNGDIIALLQSEPRNFVIINDKGEALSLGDLGLQLPTAMLPEVQGKYLIVDQGRHAVFRLSLKDPSCTNCWKNGFDVQLVSGRPCMKGSTNGDALCARFNAPYSLSRLYSGAYMLSERFGYRIRVLTVSFSEEDIMSYKRVAASIQDSMAEMYNFSEQVLSEFTALSDACHNAISSHTVNHSLLLSALHLKEVKARCERSSFKEGSFRFEEALSLVACYPSITSLQPLFTNSCWLDWPDQLQEIKLVFERRLSEYTWPVLSSPLSKSDLQALAEIYQCLGTKLLDEYSFDMVFRKPSFSPNCCIEIFQLLAQIHSNHDWENKKDMQLAISSWINRICPVRSMKGAYFFKGDLLSN